MTTLNPACLLRPADLDQEKLGRLNREEYIGQPSSDGTYLLRHVDSWQACYDITLTKEAGEAFIEGTLTFGVSGIPNDKRWSLHCNTVFTGYWYQ